MSHAGSQLAAALRHILRGCGGGEAVVFGCTSGKDRTGLLSALVLGLLGASDTAIVEDYLISNEAVDSITFLNFRNQRRDLKTVTPTDVAMVRAPLMPSSKFSSHTLRLALRCVRGLA